MVVWHKDEQSLAEKTQGSWVPSLLAHGYLCTLHVVTTILRVCYALATIPETMQIDLQHEGKRSTWEWKWNKQSPDV